VDGTTVHLTEKEYRILELLFLRGGSIVAKESFLNHLYGGNDEPDIKIIDVFVCKLRRKLALAGAGDVITTVWGRGYIVRDAGGAAQTGRMEASVASQAASAVKSLGSTTPISRAIPTPLTA
jgi:two-component system cell cycle response regulator CtrA